MAITDRYASPDDLPDIVPLFPLDGALLLPRAQLPLNIFEPRYLAMVTAALSGQRLIGMIQTRPDRPAGDDSPPPLHRIGCVGRITSYSETDNDRYIITLTGICRFAISRELASDTPYRLAEVDFSSFANDLEPGRGEEEVDRQELLDTFKAYLDANDLRTDWEEVNRASNETLVNTLSVISPYEPAEKQALLEADDLKDRARVLIALTEMALARNRDTGQGNLQ